MRRLLKVLTTLAVIAACAMGWAWAPNAARAAEFGDDWQPVQRQITKGGKYYLQEDVTWSRSMTITSSNAVTIDLNGHTITFNGTGACLYIGAGANVTIQDSAGGGKIVGGTGNADYASGGGVFMADSSNGGTKLVLSGGTIEGCSASKGGGVYVGRGATFTMAGGAIKGCSAGSTGGGVYVAAKSETTGASGGTFVMTGGTIEGCSATQFGGGVVLNGDNAVFRMSGSASITGNSVTRGSGSAIALLGKVPSTMYADGGRVVGGVHLNSGKVTRSATASDYTSFDGTVQILSGSVDDSAKVAVSFDGNGGSPQTSVLRTFKGQKLGSRPATPTKDGALFVGWYAGDTPFDFDAPVAGPTSVSARWTSSITDATVSLDQDSFAYDGQAHVPVVTVSLPSGTLAEGTNYQLEGETSATDAGTHTIVVKGLGALGGSREISWSIEPADQTVTAEDVSTTYGVTDAAVSAEGFGALSYEVVSGSDVVAVDGTTGRITTLGIGDAKVRVSAAGDTNHRGASTEVTVSVGKGTPRISAWPTIGDLYVNEALDDGHLEGGSSETEGDFSLVTQGESWESAGEREVDVVFSPADDAHYLPLTQRARVSVVRRTVERVVGEAPSVEGAKTGTPLGGLGLPSVVTIATSGGKEYEVPVLWGGYDAKATGPQTLTGTLDLTPVADEVQQADPEVVATATVTLQAPAPTKPRPVAPKAAPALPRTGDDTPAGLAGLALAAGAACLALGLHTGRRVRG